MSVRIEYDGRHHEFVDNHFAKYMRHDGSFDRDEFHHRYVGMILGVYSKEVNPKTGKDEEVCTPYIVERLANNGPKMLMSPIIGTGTKEFDITTHRFAWTNPTIGVVNYKDSVVYLSIEAGHNWRQGFTSGMMNYTDPLFLDTKLLSREGIIGPRWRQTNQMIAAMYKGFYFSFDDALRRIEAGTRRAAAFSQKYFIANSLVSERPIIGYKMHIIGEYGEDGYIHVVSNARHLVDELSQYRPCQVMEV